jgi:chromosome segregation ATPase
MCNTLDGVAAQQSGIADKVADAAKLVTCHKQELQQTHERVQLLLAEEEECTSRLQELRAECKSSQLRLQESSGQLQVAAAERRETEVALERLRQESDAALA